MEALGGLAVAERDILVRFAHSDSGPLRRLRSLRSPRPRLALPVLQDEICGVSYRIFNVETACEAIFSLAD